MRHFKSTDCPCNQQCSVFSCGVTWTVDKAWTLPPETCPQFQGQLPEKSLYYRVGNIQLTLKTEEKILPMNQFGWIGSQRKHILLRFLENLFLNLYGLGDFFSQKFSCKVNFRLCCRWILLAFSLWEQIFFLVLQKYNIYSHTDKKA